ncbi:MAG: response regulator transcription factor [Clostridia bacterium]|nr:response regulator transcription factor [Clostridia bacterium]
MQVNLFHDGAKYKIFIVEDDDAIAAGITKGLETWGCEVHCVNNFSNIMDEFVAFEPQLVLMDITLPFFNGYYWCGEIRKVSKVPVIFISSASDNMNIVMAMSMGADDFIAKPFDMNVLMAKVQAMLRRTYDFGGDTHLVSHNGLVLNLNNQSLTYEGKEVDLTKNEYKILQMLMERRGSIVRRDEIMAYLWESEEFVDENTLSVNITRIRKKLDAVGLVDYITTKKGVGYIIN